MRRERPVVVGHRWRGGTAPGRRVVAGAEARAALRRGMAALSAAIRPTLGPVARTVAVARDVGTRPPEILDAGATIARRTIELDDPSANMGAMLLRHVVWQVHERVGDGTATAAVLAQGLLDAALPAVAAGADPRAIGHGIERGVAVVLEGLRSRARPIDLPVEIAGVVRGIVRDPALAELIGEVVDAVGSDGAVQLKDGPLAATTCEYVEGVRWSGGIVSPYLLRDGEAMATLDRPRIFVADRVLDRAEHLVPVVEACAAAGERALFVVAPEVRDAALALLLVNRDRGVLKEVAAVKAPGLGRQRTQALADLAVITGGRCRLAEEGMATGSVCIDDLGTARQAWATRTLAGVLGGHGDRGLVRRRIGEARAELRLAADDGARAAIRERLGRLTGAAAIIRVGGRTKTEQAELKSRLEAALAAGRAALREGVVPGGGAAYVACTPALTALGLDGDAAVGARVLARALAEPMQTILTNAGVEPWPIVEAVRCRGEDRVYDVLSGAWVDPWATGLVDPIEVVATALEVAASGVVAMLTIDTLVRGSRPEVTRNP